MEDDSFGYIEEEIHEIVSRYEQMRRNNENYFFDVSEFETIIDYYLELNDVSFAYEAAESATRQHPHAPSIQLRKAKVLIDKGRPVDALKIAKLIENIEPSNFEVYILKGAALGMLGDIKGTKKYFDVAIKLDENEKIGTLLSITAILNNLNHYRLLTEYLKQLTELEPEYSTHLYDLAFAYEKLDETDNSIKYYKKFLEEEPFSDNAWYNLGLLYNKEEKLEKAIEAYDYALAVNPDNFFALFNMANIMSKQGRYKEALEAYLHYLDFEEESTEAMTYAADCYFKMGQKDKAVKMYHAAIDIDPDFAEPWYGMGVLLLDDKPGESIRYLNKAVELKKDDPEYWYYLSEAHYESGNIKKAMRSLMHSINLDPYYDSSWLRIGQIMIKHEYHYHAIQVLEKALRVIGDVHGLRYLIAATNLFNAEQEKFMLNLKHALNDSPESFSFFRTLFPDKLLDEETRVLIKQKTK